MAAKKQSRLMQILNEEGFKTSTGKQYTPAGKKPATPSKEDVKRLTGGQKLKDLKGPKTPQTMKAVSKPTTTKAPAPAPKPMAKPMAAKPVVMGKPDGSVTAMRVVRMGSTEVKPMAAKSMTSANFKRDYQMGRVGGAPLTMAKSMSSANFKRDYESGRVGGAPITMGMATPKYRPNATKAQAEADAKARAKASMGKYGKSTLPKKGAIKVGATRTKVEGFKGKKVTQVWNGTKWVTKK